MNIYIGTHDHSIAVNAQISYTLKSRCSHVKSPPTH